MLKQKKTTELEYQLLQRPLRSQMTTYVMLQMKKTTLYKKLKRGCNSSTIVPSSR
jgi:hypothetical protein